MISLISIALAGASLQRPDPWLTFSKAPAFDRRVTTVEVGTLNASPEWHYWFRRTVRSGNEAEVWWTDTARCPAARSILVEAETLPSPTVDIPGVKRPGESDDISVVADGVGYSIESWATYGKQAANHLRFTSNVNTPLAAWIEESLGKLEPCWSKNLPSG